MQTTGIIIERGSTGDNAIIMWDESVDKFTLGITTATADSQNSNSSYWYFSCSYRR